MKIGLLTFELGIQYNDVMGLFNYAETADKLGFSRFWIGEHYDDPYNYWSNPEPLIPLLLGHTERINVGTAGTLVRLHNPFRTATFFKTLNAIFLGRVDLGMAGGYANDQTVEALTGHTMEEFIKIDRYQNVRQIVSYYREEKKYIDQGVYITPSVFPSPNIWVLSFSYRGVDYAIESKACYSRTLFHSAASKEPNGAQAQYFRNKYQEVHGEPGNINVAFAGVLGKSAAHAKSIYEGSSSVYVSNPHYNPNIMAGPKEFYDQVMQMGEDYGVDEVVFLDFEPDMDKRIENLYQISEMFQLKEAVPVLSNS